MSQNINLLGPAFRRQRRALTLATVVQCFGVTLAAMLAYHLVLQHQASGLTAELRTAEGLLGSQRNYVEKLKGKPAAVKPDAQLEAEVGRLEGELKTAQEAVETLQGGRLGSQQGFAEYLRAFSRQSLNGLWLTGFSIAGNGELEIRGRVLSPDLVPSYIQRLNREQVLAGRSFARLEMSRPKPEPAPAAPAKDKGSAAAPAALPRYLDFSLATVDRTEKTP
ncbi:MAG: PilN domain-containing protein [Burkholderiales bacterium]